MEYYKKNAKDLFFQYQSLAPENVHKTWLHNLPCNPTHALDIGAGSGRDAIWLAKKGWQVTAVEPCKELSRLAPSHPNVRWLIDSLPSLTQLNSKSSELYQLILVSAVWMHLSPKEQLQSLKRLKEVLAPNGILVITWRNQAFESTRQFYNVSTNQFKDAIITRSNDERARDGVIWQCAVISKKEN